MYVTPIIDGYSYAFTSEDNQLKNTLDALQNLKDVAVNTDQLSPLFGTEYWAQTYKMGEKIYNAYQTISASKYNVPAYPKIQDIANPIFPFGLAANLWNNDLKDSTDRSQAVYGKRQELVEYIQSIRTNSLSEIEAAFEELKPLYEQEIILRQDLQNFVTFQYAMAGEDVLNTNLNILGEVIEINNQTMQALSYLNAVLGADVKLKMNLEIETPSDILTPGNESRVSMGRADLLEAAGSMGKMVSATHTGGYQFRTTFNLDPMYAKLWPSAGDKVVIPSTNLDYMSSTFTIMTQPTLVSGTIYTVDIEQVTPPSTLADFGSTLPFMYDHITQAKIGEALVQDINTIVANHKIWSFGGANYEWFDDQTVHADVRNAIMNAEYFNQTKQKKLEEIFFVYTKFLQSASTFMSTIDQAISGSAQRINR